MSTNHLLLLGSRRAAQATLGVLVAALPRVVLAQGFDKINTTVTNVNTILVMNRPGL